MCDNYIYQGTHFFPYLPAFRVDPPFLFLSLTLLWPSYAERQALLVGNSVFVTWTSSACQQGVEFQVDSLPRVLGQYQLVLIITSEEELFAGGLLACPLAPVTSVCLQFSSLYSTFGIVGLQFSHYVFSLILEPLFSTPELPLRVEDSQVATCLPSLPPLPSPSPSPAVHLFILG